MEKNFRSTCMQGLPANALLELKSIIKSEQAFTQLQRTIRPTLYSSTSTRTLPTLYSQYINDPSVLQ